MTMWTTCMEEKNMRLYEEVIRLFPEHLRFLWKNTAEEGAHLQEIRLRAQKPVILIIGGKEVYPDSSGRLTEDFSKARILP